MRVDFSRLLATDIRNRQYQTVLQSTRQQDLVVNWSQPQVSFKAAIKPQQ